MAVSRPVQTVMNALNDQCPLIVTGPILLWPPGEPNSREGMFGKVSAPDGLLVQFLRDFGKTLLNKCGSVESR